MEHPKSSICVAFISSKDNPKNPKLGKKLWRTPNSSRDSNVSPSIKQRNKEELEHAP
jgi:hypothetical protein